MTRRTIPGTMPPWHASSMKSRGVKGSQPHAARKRREVPGIYENLQDVYVEATVEGTILEISPQIEQLSGGQYTREGLIGTDIKALYDDPAQRTKLIQALKGKRRGGDFEIMLRNRDGTHIPCSISSKLLLDEASDPIRITSMIRDISERKRAELAARESQTATARSDGGIAGSGMAERSGWPLSTATEDLSVYMVQRSRRSPEEPTTTLLTASWRTFSANDRAAMEAGKPV